MKYIYALCFGSKDVAYDVELVSESKELLDELNQYRIDHGLDESDTWVEQLPVANKESEIWKYLKEHPYNQVYHVRADLNCPIYAIPVDIVSVLRKEEIGSLHINTVKDNNCNGAVKSGNHLSVYVIASYEADAVKQAEALFEKYLKNIGIRILVPKSTVI